MKLIKDGEDTLAGEIPEHGSLAAKMQQPFSRSITMNLESFSFPSVLNTSDADIITDFFIPALSASVRYDRGVGFFSAGWLRVAAEGMAAFARNSGRARWVTNPILSEKNWQALQLRETARHKALRQAIERNLHNLEQERPNLR